jgi:tripartite-type tricarboxylate transporter receptor subunit TctC
VILNTAGAGGTIGAARVASAKGDGYTIGMLPVGPLTTQPHLIKLSYGPESFDYVCLVYSNPQVLIVRSDSPFRTVNDLVAAAKREPGRLSYGSTGVGSVPHLAMVALAKAAGADMLHVPHKGDADELASLLGGHITTFVTHTAMLASHAGSLRALGLMANSRLKEYPDIPTFAEQGAPPLAFDVWGGLVAPRGTPEPVIAALENACRTGTSSDGFRKQLENLQTPVNYMDSRTFASFVKAEYERNGRLLREAGIQKE